MTKSNVQQELYDRIVLTIEQNTKLLVRTVSVADYAGSLGIESNLGAVQLEAIQKEFEGYVYFLDGFIVVDENH